MRIGLDTDPVGRNASGNETFLRGIVRGLQQVLGEDDLLLLVGGERAAVAALGGPRTETVAAPGGLLGELLLGTSMRRAGADVAVGTYNAPLAFGGPRATVVHDVAYRRAADTFPRPLRARIEASVARSVRVSDLIVTVSQFSRSELLACYPSLDPDHVVVVPNAPDPAFSAEVTAEARARVAARYKLPPEFVLAVGNVQPRKNLARLAAATARARIPLVVVGQPTWQSGPAVAAIRAAGARWLGHVPQEDLVALYASCRVFAYPSLYEGFGLPVIEAMAAGAAVVTSRSSALVEVAGTAALTVDPTDIDDIARGIARAVTDDALRTRLGALGRARAAQFRWGSSAAVLLDALRRIA